MARSKCSVPNCKKRKIERVVLDPETLEVAQSLCYAHVAQERERFHGPRIEVMVSVFVSRHYMVRYVEFPLTTPESVHAVFDRIGEITEAVMGRSQYCTIKFYYPYRNEDSIHFRRERSSDMEKVEKLRAKLVRKVEENDLWTRTVQGGIMDYF